MIRECLKIIGTAHVSQNSADEVRAAILEDQPDVVAIELDRGRYQRLMNERNGVTVYSNMVCPFISHVITH